jgi:hypothetical protein
VLVDREDVPAASYLPAELRFLPELQVGRIRHYDDRDPDVFAEHVADLLRIPAGRIAASAAEGAECTRSALEVLLRRMLPPAQQWMGNRDRLLDLPLAVLGRDDRLIFSAPGKIRDGPRGSTTVLVTASDVMFVEVDETFLVSGEIRFPRSLARRVEVVPSLPLFADALVHTTAGRYRPAAGAVPRPGATARRPPPSLRLSRDSQTLPFNLAPAREFAGTRRGAATDERTDCQAPSALC